MIELRDLRLNTDQELRGKMIQKKYEVNKEKNKRLGWFAVVGCLMVDVCVGEFNLLSHLYPYLHSYFLMEDEKFEKSHLTYIPMIWLLTQSFLSPIGIALFKYLGYRGSFAFFLTVFGFGQIVSSYLKNYWVFLPIFAVTGGMAQGGCIILPLYCGWRYFPASYKTRISGILLSAYALAPIASSFIALYIVNPDNIKADKDGVFPKEVAKNVPKFLKIFGAGALVFGMLGVLLIFDPYPTSLEEEMKMKRKKAEVENDEVDSSEYSKHEERKLEEVMNPHDNMINDTLDMSDLNEASLAVEKVKMVKTTIEPMKGSDFLIFKDRYFLHVFFIMVIGYLYPHLGLATFKSLGLSGKLDDKWITTAGFVGSLVNAGCRLIIGVAYEKYGYLCCAIFIIFVQITSSLTLQFSADNKWGYMLWLSWFFITYGAQLGLYPLVSDTLFHGKGAFSYTILFSAFTLSSVVILNVKDYLGKALGNKLLYLIAVINLIPIYSMYVIQRRIKSIMEENKRKQEDEMD